MMTKISISVFHSYAHKDRKVVESFIYSLREFAEKNNVQLKSWHDRNIKASDEWIERLDVEIENATCIIVHLTLNSIKSEFVKKEIEKARLHDKQIIPIMWDDDIEIPDYIGKQAIKFHECSGMEELLTNVLNILIGGVDIEPDRRNMNLFVTSLTRRSGRTAIISAIKDILAPLQPSAYFKPFHRRNNELADVKFMQRLFNIPVSISLSPFEYGASLPNCTDEELRNAFKQVANGRYPTLIEGTLFSSSKFDFSHMISNIFDANILIVIDYQELDDMPIIEELAQLRQSLNNVKIGFVFNKVPRSGLNDIGLEIQEKARSLDLIDIGIIYYDKRLTGISLTDIIRKCNGQPLEKIDDPDELIWEFGQATFAEADAVAYYTKRKQEAVEDIEQVIYTGATKFSNMELISLGYHLFLTGANTNVRSKDTLIEISRTKKKYVICFDKSAQQAINDVNKAMLELPFCYIQKIDFIKSAASQLDIDKLTLLMKRPNKVAIK